MKHDSVLSLFGDASSTNIAFNICKSLYYKSQLCGYVQLEIGNTAICQIQCYYHMNVILKRFNMTAMRHILDLICRRSKQQERKEQVWAVRH